jgi:hypothetical protein
VSSLFLTKETRGFDHKDDGHEKVDENEGKLRKKEDSEGLKLPY